MTKSTLDRTSLVVEACVFLGVELRADLIEKANTIIWYNKLNPSSLRLTHEGLLWFTRSQTKFHTIELADPIRPKQMLQLEKLLNSPYYLRQMAQKPSIMVSNEQDAVMLQLHGGDLNTYLDNLELQ